MDQDEAAFVVEGATREERSEVHAGRWPPVRRSGTAPATGGRFGNREAETAGLRRRRFGARAHRAFPCGAPSDATNYLGGVGAVLEAKDRRGALPHLGELLDVASYLNDRQIHEVHYRWERAATTQYVVKVWRL